MTNKTQILVKIIKNKKDKREIYQYEKCIWRY